MRNNPKTYSTFDINKKLHIKVDRLKDWMTRGFIIPSIQKASGQGTKNIFSLDDLYLIKLFQYLVSKKGFSRDDAALRIRLIKDQHQMAQNYDKIRKNKLNRDGLVETKVKFENLKKIYFLVFYSVEDEKNAAAIHNLPPKVDAVILENGSEHNNSIIDLNRYRGCDEILVINFKIIREQVDSALI